MIVLICSFPPVPPNDFVNLFVFGGTLPGREPPRAPAAREAAPGTISGGRCHPPNPPVFFCSGHFWRGRFGRCSVDFGSRMCRIRPLLDDYVNLFGGLCASPVCRRPRRPAHRLHTTSYVVWFPRPRRAQEHLPAPAAVAHRMGRVEHRWVRPGALNNN